MWQSLFDCFLMANDCRRSQRRFAVSTVPAEVEIVESRRLLSASSTINVLTDSFSASSSQDINSGAGSRQTGIFGGTTYLEQAQTASGGANDWATQLNAGVANTLQLATSNGQAFTYITPNVPLFDSRFGTNSVQVVVTPVGPQTVDTTDDSWAGIALGGPAGSYVSSFGTTGLDLRKSGAYEIFENGSLVKTGFVTTASSYAVNIAITSQTGAYSITINGAATPIYSGTHTGGAFLATDSLTLERYEAVPTTIVSGTNYTQASNFGNLQITGYAATTNILTDGFQTTVGTTDVNSQVITRQTGVLAGTNYSEQAQTVLNGTVDWATQVNNNASRPSSLQLATTYGQNFTYVSPAATFFDSQLDTTHLHVDITPVGPGSTDTNPTPDNWAGVALGGQAGSLVNAAGVTGLTIRANGAYAIYENGTAVQSGGVTAASTYGVDFWINPQNGAYTITINGALVPYYGNHTGGSFVSSDTVTLEAYSSESNSARSNLVLIDYFGNFQVTGFTTSANILTDNFNTTSSTDINSNVASRQTGILAGSTYSEPSQNVAVGSNDAATQLNSSTSVPGHLQFVNTSSQTFTYASPSASLFNSTTNDIKVSMTSLGAGTTDNTQTDNWTAIVLGGAAGARYNSAGVTALLIRSVTQGQFELYENGQLVSWGVIPLPSGTTNPIGVTNNVEFKLTPSTGAYTVWINGTQTNSITTGGLYAGSHGAAYGSADHVTLESGSGRVGFGQQVDYFWNFQVSGTSGTILSDNFLTASNTNDINASVATRQTGTLAGSIYLENPLTSHSAGAYDWASQVNAGVSNSLQLATTSSNTYVYASPKAALFDSRYGTNHIHVDVTPLGPQTLDATSDEWAGIAWGGAAGAYVQTAGVSGLTIRKSGAYEVYENGIFASSGNLPTYTTTGTKTFGVDLWINPQNGAYSIVITSPTSATTTATTTVFSGTHGAAYLCTDALTLETVTNPGTGSPQTANFGNLQVTGLAVSTNLLTDRFLTTSSGVSADVTSQNSTRQTGLLAGSVYSELFNATTGTASGQPYDAFTQVNAGNVVGSLSNSNSLLIATSNTKSFTYVSTNDSLFDPMFGVNHIRVTITPAGAGSTGTPTDGWAGLALGGASGSFVQALGVTGITIRANGAYQILENNVSVTSGAVAASTSYRVDIAINPQSGAYCVSINGQVVTYGNHGGPYSTGKSSSYTNLSNITLQSYSAGTTTYQQNNFFSGFQVTGITVPYAAKSNTAYYVSPSGNDSNSGLSLTQAWKTLARANQVFFQAGDSLLLEGGQTFSGTINLTAPESGTTSAPVTISSYSSTSGSTATINSGSSDAITIDNGSNFTIANLNLVGAGYNVGNFLSGNDGVYGYSNQISVAQSGIVINQVNASGFGHSGVSLYGQFNSTKITNSTLSNNGCGGLWMDGAIAASQNVYIGYVTASNNAGSDATQFSAFGILLSASQYSVIERSTAINNGWVTAANGNSANAGNFGGIDANGSSYDVIQYCEAASNHQSAFGQGDGDGIIFNDTSNSIMQYNYSHDNYGGGLWVGADPNVTSTGNVVRYNISQNDARAGASEGGILIWEDINNTDIYNNTVYMNNPATSLYYVACVAINQFIGSGVRIRDNILVTSGAVPSTGTLAVVNFLTANGNSSAYSSGITLQGNDYWSYSNQLQFNWLTTTSTSLNAFRTASSQEKNGTTNVGFQVNPGLTTPGGGGTVNNPNNLASSLAAYNLKSTSALRHAGLDLSTFGTVWDPFSFGNNAFLALYFSSTKKDFYGNVLPANGSGSFSIGANQFT